MTQVWTVQCRSFRFSISEVTTPSDTGLDGINIGYRCHGDGIACTWRCAAAKQMTIVSL